MICKKYLKLYKKACISVTKKIQSIDRCDFVRKSPSHNYASDTSKKRVESYFEAVVLELER